MKTQSFALFAILNILLFGLCWGEPLERGAALAEPTAPMLFHYAPTATLVLIKERTPAFIEASIAGKLFSVSPPLPPGLTLDTKTGSISGIPTSVSSGRVYRVLMRNLDHPVQYYATVWIEVVEAPELLTQQFFVSPLGNDANPGTSSQPFRTVQRGLVALGPGSTLNLREGTYLETVRAIGLAGTANSHITIRSYPGENAIIDGSLPDFRIPGNSDWEPVPDHPGEWVSKRVFSEVTADIVNRGAFLDRTPYTRLLSYSRIEDLRATNQTDDAIAADDPRPGPFIVSPRDPNKPRRPWTYFGPGLYWDAVKKRVHVRLSPTTNNILGMDDYAGPADPRQVALSVSLGRMIAFKLTGCQYVDLRHVAVHHGGGEAMHIEDGNAVTLDHVLIRAASYGLQIKGTAARTRVLHTVIDGGMPTWSFRTDFKNAYQILTPNSPGAQNDLVRHSVKLLTLFSGTATGTEIAYSEFRSGHDLYIGGQGTDFHHNLIESMQDDAMFLNDTPEAGGTRIHENVVRRVLTAVSFDGGYAGVERLIYRNVFDLRGAVAGVRPTGASNHDPWLYGHVFKDGKVVSPFSYYQNTALISRGQSQFATQFFSLPATAISPVNKRHVFNNLFRYIAPIPNDVPVAVFPSLAQVELLDAHGLRAYRNEGNAWDRTGATTLPLFVCGTRVPHDRCKYRNFQTLMLMQAAPEYKALGWERSSIEGPAGLVSVGSDGVVRATDGLRLGPNAPALKAGVILQLPDPYAPMTGPPDIGAFQTGQDILGVGRNTGAAVY